MQTTLKALLLILVMTVVGYAETKKSCSEKDIKALNANFDKTYKNYKYYSKVLTCYEDRAMRGDAKTISSVMDLYNVGQQNAEFTEWHYELMANLFVKYPAKFLDVLMTKDQDTIDYGMNRLKRPLIVETDAISAAAKKIRKNPKYKKLAEELIY